MNEDRKEKQNIYPIIVKQDTTVHSSMAIHCISFYLAIAWDDIAQRQSMVRVQKQR